MMRVFPIVIFLVAATSVANSSAASPSFIGLGNLVGPSSNRSSQPLAISADGSVIVGFGGTTTTTAAAFRWTEGGGMQPLGELPGGTVFGMAQGISADGSVIVGYSVATGQDAAFRWTQADGMVALPAPLLGEIAATANTAEDVSADGRVIVGYSERNGFPPRAVRWVDGIPSFLSPELSYSQAYAISDDGSVIVGRATFPSGSTLAFRWTEATGMQPLGDLPGGDAASLAFAICGNSNVIVGVGNSGTSHQFRWTEATGMQDLGGVYPGRALACSDDGSVIVGDFNRPDGSRVATIWDAQNGIRNLQDVLLELGVTGAVGWENMVARGISADGRIIVGEGWRPDGRVEGWRVVLVPEPSSFLLAALAIVTLAAVKVNGGGRFRRKHHRSDAPGSDES